MMANFVLVHGAWIGGWCWRPNAQAPRRAGHEVYTPTMTGLGERSHLLNPSINIDTHITDIVNVIKHKELSDVVLVGHSYGGMVVAGVADTLPGKISSLVYLDAFVPENGQSLFGLLPPFRRFRPASVTSLLIPYLELRLRRLYACAAHVLRNHRAVYLPSAMGQVIPNDRTFRLEVYIERCNAKRNGCRNPTCGQPGANRSRRGTYSHEVIQTKSRWMIVASFGVLLGRRSYCGVSP
jgi:pimeloyl-ACP methyl ester carboxylesterase